MVDVALTINGREIRAEVPPKLTLLRFLRDYLGLMGTKNGCSRGHCGVCTVILDGKATRSCLVRMEKAQGVEVETIENLARGGILHPIQQAFIVYGGLQCGFCTPAMILAAKALLDANPSPSREEIISALSKNHNTCRCTGYVKVVDAIEATDDGKVAYADYQQYFN